MRIIEEVSAMRDLSEESRQRNDVIGFVPTMGYLHEGHLSLVRLARRRADRVVVSIFVNPTQFGPGEDFETYPRDLERDEELLKGEGCDVVFTPSAEEMYPPGYCSSVVVEGLSEKLCGQSRPGHFAGVAEVVLKLLHIVSPDFAVFGEKDFQQLVIIRRMVRDLNLGVDIVSGPTVREPDGLAASSRNRYLSPEERKQATSLHRALTAAEHLVRSGEGRADRLKQAMQEVIGRAPLAKPEYISIVDPETLEEVRTVTGRTVAALAVRFEDTRLIDNIELIPRG